jgi:hypothetical protein
MNTKSLLLAAVVAAVGAVSGSAQVTSQNIVGYVRLSLSKGYNLIGNQLNNGNNAIGTVLNVPDGTAVYKFTGGKYVANSFVDGAWDAPGMTLAPGEGFFVNVPAATTITLIGEVSLNNSAALVDGFNLLSVPVPLAGGLTDAAAGGLTAAEGDAVYQWTGTKFSLSEYVDGEWSPSAPTVKVGEGFFLKGAARTYTRNFSVN